MTEATRIITELPPSELAFWNKEQEACRKWMKPKQKLWRSLLDQYGLKYDMAGYDEDEVIAISSFYPKSRQLIASIAFNHPQLFFAVEDQADTLAADLLERAGNAALDLMQAKERVQQAIFYALFCNVGWLDLGYNPPGDQDTELPYTVNDSLEQDFTYLRAPSPFDVYVDPLTPPDNIGMARYIFEDMWVPLSFIKRDPRFVNRNKIEPSVVGVDEEDIGSDFDGDTNSDREGYNEWRESLENGQMVRLTRIHDRIGKKRICFAKGVEQPIEVMDAPFARQVPIMLPNPLTGQMEATGQFKLGDGFLVGNGFSIYPLRFDIHDTEFYGLPVMAYAEDTQKLQVESITRRADLLQRTPRITKVAKSAVEDDPGLRDKLRNPKDGDTLELNDIHNDLAPMDWSQVPVDQLGIESDARRYEDLILQTSAVSATGGTRKTATLAALEATVGQLNREWMQGKIADLYRWIISSCFKIFADARYTPDQFIINVSGPNQSPVFQAVKADLFANSFRVKVIATSMQPMIEQIEQERSLAMFNYLIQLPEIDRTEAIRSLLQAFGKGHEIDRFLRDSVHADASKLSHMENTLLQQGQSVPVQLEEDHQTHIPIHQEFLQQLQQNIGQIQAMGGMDVNALTQLVTAAQQGQAHVNGHRQAQQQLASPTVPGGAGGSGSGNVVPSMVDQAGIGGIPGQASDLISQTRSAAQQMSQELTDAPGQN